MKRKNTLKFTFITLLITSMVLTAIIFSKIYKVKKFREHPSKNKLEKFLIDDTITGYLAKYLIFKKGNKSYNNTIWKWCYESNKLSNEKFNKLILTKSLKNININERKTLFEYFPFPMDMVDDYIKNELETKDAHIYIPRLANESYYIRNIKEYLNKILEEKIIFSKDEAPIALNNILAFPHTEIDKILDKYWNTFDYNTRSLLIYEMYENVPMKTKTSFSLIKWISINKKTIPFDNNIGYLLSEYADANSPEEEAFFKEVIVFIVNNHPEIFISTILDTLADSHIYFLSELFDFSLPNNTDIALEIFHGIAHYDLDLAESLAKSIVEGKDSTLKKGIIVLLARHDSRKGLALIDESFKGQSPRKTMFPSTYLYRYGSEATDLYTEITGHDYLETGKTWPPSIIKPIQNEVSRLLDFIEEYPWHPAYDDAYYRIAANLFAQGNLDITYEFAMKFDPTGRPDIDASPFIGTVISAVALSNHQIDSETLRALQILQSFHKILVEKNVDAQIRQKNIYINTAENFFSEERNVTMFFPNPNLNQKFLSLLNTLKSSNKNDFLHASISKALNREPLILSLLFGFFHQQSWFHNNASTYLKFKDPILKNIENGFLNLYKLANNNIHESLLYRLLIDAYQNLPEHYREHLSYLKTLLNLEQQ